ncbi:MAG: carbon monoxide dehydrogenase [Planctomycetaceae bacterium]|nr:carbon monoxide dehydrogenase [Planctomycetaceae bacterium]
MGGLTTLSGFQYVAPMDLAAAATALRDAEGRARVLAGGTDILVQLREGMRDADLLVDVKKIPELVELEYSADAGLRLGAATPCYQIYTNAEVVNAYPALVDATRIIGGWQIQSRASVGGNLCNSSPAADGIPPLMVHQAVCHLAAADGRRSVPVNDFCTGPGTNTLSPGELLATITLPPSPPGSGSAFQRFIPRNEMDIAVASAASWIELNEAGDTIQAARVALGAVAPTPVLADEAGQFLVGKAPNEDNFAEAGVLARKVASPIDDMRGTVEFRVHLVGVLTQRTLALAYQRAQDGAGHTGH